MEKLKKLSEANYYEKVNFQFLVGLWLHIPICLLTAYLAKQSLALGVLMGFGIASGPTLLLLKDRGSLLTSIANAVALVSFSALLIYISGGMTELHFHIFAAFGVMIVLAQPLAILAALLFVVVHHVGFFFLLPSGLINYEASFGILLIHAAFALSIGIPAIFTSRKFKLYIIGVKEIIEEIEGISSDISNTSSFMLQNSENLSSSTNKESVAIQETSKSVELLNSVITKNFENAKLASENCETSKRLSGRALEVVNQVVQSLGAIQSNSSAISEAVERSNQGMESIIQVIQAIGSKTQVINDIVFQTKLLSFNASVEAARAGEHGKGFAVVADEVGNLAGMSGKSAKEISELLEKSTSSVKSIIEVSKRSVGEIIAGGRSKIESGIQIAEECKMLLGEIDSNLNQVLQSAATIAHASSEQTQQVSEITRAMSDMRSASQENNSAAKQATGVAHDIASSSENMSGAIAKLLGAIDQQQDGSGKP
jgi:methyl-accepting chemotaxis protein